MTEDKKSGLPRGIGWGILGLIAIFIIGFLFAFGVAKERARERIAGSLEELRYGVEDLRKLDADSAVERFSRIGEEVKNLRDALGIFSPLWSGTEELMAGFQDLAEHGIALEREVEFLRANAMRLFLSSADDGMVLAERLEAASESLKSIDASAKKLASAATSLGDITPFPSEFYLSLQLDLARFIGFFDLILPKLKSDGFRLLVLFQNSSEIRPAGGFLGSYADVLVRNGRLESVEARDINDVDREFDDKIVPPRPLQAVAASWRPYDANWFFDFPVSAKKSVDFFEMSELYEENTFDGVVAVSPKVVEDILSLIGPVEIPEKKVVFASDNFVTETQRIVQESRVLRATYPKAVLDDFLKLLLARAREAENEVAGEFWNLAAKWIGNKDLMFWLKEPKLQGFIRHYGASGGVYELPAGFTGDYLAIVDANIDGGKSDLFIEQKVVLESQINLDGTVNNHLAIDRIHEGNKSRYWWHKEENQNYLQVFVPESARLVNFSGGVDKRIAPKVDYAKEGYKKDPLVSSIEDSAEQIFNFPAVRAHKESGKRVFSTWSATKAGAKTQIIFDYVTRLYLRPADGAKHQFIFEKQAGTNRVYKFQINAPVGFRFRENGLPVYTYESKNIPGRLIIDLTLDKI